MSSPHFGLVFSIDGNRVVACISPIVLPDRPLLVLKAAGVDNHAPAIERKFEAERVAVSVTRLIIRSQQLGIQYNITRL